MTDLLRKVAEDVARALHEMGNRLFEERGAVAARQLWQLQEQLEVAIAKEGEASKSAGHAGSGGSPPGGR